MRIFKTLVSGAAAAVSSYKLILVVWVTTLVLVLAVGLPLKSFLGGIFGNSMAIARLNDGLTWGSPVILESLSVHFWLLPLPVRCLPVRPGFSS